MSAPALALVVGSAFLHAAWNLLYKRALDKPSFAWLFGLATVVIYLPAFLLLAFRSPIPPEGWQLMATSGALHSLYFYFLGRGYACGELSLVYPLARGTGPLLVVLWAALFLDQRPSSLGLLGVLSVVAGVYVLHLKSLSWSRLLAPLLSTRAQSTRAALFTGLLISLYTTVDAAGVRHVDPLIYMYPVTAIYSLLYGPYVLRTSGAAAVRREWKANAHPSWWWASSWSSPTPWCYWP